MILANPTFELVHGVIRHEKLIAVSIVNTALRRADGAAVLFGVYEVGAWKNAGLIPELITAAAVVDHPSEQFALLSEAGRVHFAGGGDRHVETIGRTVPLALRGLNRVAGLGHAVGMGYQVYRREAVDTWRAVDSGLPDTGAEVKGFEDIDGFGLDDMYAVGWGGEIWHYNGTLWQDVGSPVNAILSGVCCADDGAVYACGRSGVLVAGRGDVWSVVGNREVADDFWDVVWFKGRLYVAGMRALYTLEDGVLVPVNVTSEGYRGTHYQLSRTDTALCSVGARDVILYDGTTWTRVPTE